MPGKDRTTQGNTQTMMGRRSMLGPQRCEQSTGHAQLPADQFVLRLQVQLARAPVGKGGGSAGCAGVISTDATQKNEGGPGDSEATCEPDYENLGLSIQSVKTSFTDRPSEDGPSPYQPAQPVPRTQTTDG